MRDYSAVRRLPRNGRKRVQQESSGPTDQRGNTVDCLGRRPPQKDPVRRKRIGYITYIWTNLSTLNSLARPHVFLGEFFLWP